MASPPHCRLCGTDHWSTQPHAFAEAKPKPEPKAKLVREAIAKPETEAKPNACPKCGKAPFDRKAYQRDYMRKRRAQPKD